MITVTNSRVQEKRRRKIATTTRTWRACEFGLAPQHRAAKPCLGTAGWPTSEAAGFHHLAPPPSLSLNQSISLSDSPFLLQIRPCWHSNCSPPTFPTRLLKPPKSLPLGILAAQLEIFEPNTLISVSCTRRISSCRIRRQGLGEVGDHLLHLQVPPLE